MILRSLQQLHNKVDALQSQIGALSRTVDTLSAVLNTRSGSSQSLPLPTNGGVGREASEAPFTKEPAYIGPTSFAFGLDVRGIDPWPVRRNSRQLDKCTDVVNLSKEHAFQMIELFEGTVGDVYPCVDFAAIRQCASNLFDEQPETVYRRLYQVPSSPSTFDRDFEILRAVLANGLVLEGDGQSRSAAVLMDHIETVMYNRVRVFEVDTKELLLLLLMAWYSRA